MLRIVAQTLIKNRSNLKAAGVDAPDTSTLDPWLNKGQFRGISVASPIGGLGHARSLNTSEGFARSGFAEAVKEELQRCFPGPSAGAIVCVLDNLELLRTSGEAREALEELRDTVFGLHGLRWVLCGSQGVVTHARSKRLSGVFSPPLRLGPLPHTDIVELISRRIVEYGNVGTYVPVLPGGFEFLYRAVHFNLRDALAYAQEFAQRLWSEFGDGGEDLPPEDERFGYLETWISLLAEEAEGNTRVQPRVWRFFDQVARAGGTVRASDWKQFGFSTQQQMVRAVTDLVGSNLMDREIDSENAARSFAALTPQGWLVLFHRNGNQSIL